MNAQAHIDQNGIKTSVIKNLTANATQAKRYEVAQVAMNSQHWQYSGYIIVELFSIRPYTGYEKYKIQIGYGEGTGSSSPKLKLLESHGIKHSARVELGIAYPSGTSYSGYDNMIIPIYVDVSYYAVYNVRMTYLYNKVEVLDYKDQIKIYDSPTGVALANFVSPKLDLSGDDFSMRNGNVSGDLDVAGTLVATEIKVEAQTADFVFEEDYPLRPLDEVEAFIKTNKHLPEIPSAKQMETDGVNVAEMNKLLLQKIEELTLYMLEMKRENERCHKRIDSL